MDQISHFRFNENLARHDAMDYNDVDQTMSLPLEEERSICCHCRNCSYQGFVDWIAIFGRFDIHVWWSFQRKRFYMSCNVLDRCEFCFHFAFWFGSLKGELQSFQGKFADICFFLFIFDNSSLSKLFLLLHPSLTRCTPNDSRKKNEFIWCSRQRLCRKLNGSRILSPISSASLLWFVFAVCVFLCFPRHGSLL